MARHSTIQACPHCGRNVEFIYTIPDTQVIKPGNEPHKKKETRQVKLVKEVKKSLEKAVRIFVLIVAIIILVLVVCSILKEKESTYSSIPVKQKIQNNHNVKTETQSTKNNLVDTDGDGVIYPNE